MFSVTTSISKETAKFAVLPSSDLVHPPTDEGQQTSSGETVMSAVGSHVGTAVFYGTGVKRIIKKPLKYN